MSHSRIFQITSAPVAPDDYISENDFCEHWFTNTVADYVNGDGNREDDVKWLRDWLEGLGAVYFVEDDSFIVLQYGKEAYFEKAYEAFITVRRKTTELSLSEFAAGSDFASLMYQLQSAFCDKYSFYVSSDEFDTIPFDEFIRCAEPDRRYYIGGTLDYHY
jgi:hypothetical protein